MHWTNVNIFWKCWGCVAQCSRLQDGIGEGEEEFVEKWSKLCLHEWNFEIRKKCVLLQMFVCHISITAGLFVEFDRRNGKCVAVRSFGGGCMEFVPFQEGCVIWFLTQRFLFSEPHCEGLTVGGLCQSSPRRLVLSYFHLLWEQNIRC
jgi:hypothetical protein